MLEAKIRLMRKAYMLKVRKVVISELTNNPNQTDAKTIKMFYSWVIMYEYSCIVALNNLSLIRFVD